MPPGDFVISQNTSSRGIEPFLGCMQRFGKMEGKVYSETNQYICLHYCRSAYC